jgi:purine catabolism regulator
LTLTLAELRSELGVRLVAGEPGLGRAVRWAHISELADPTPWLSGGELLLTTGLSLDGPASQRDYLARLVDAGVVGLGLGVGFGHESVPAPLREAAEAAGFPVFEIPYEMPFIAVTERVAFHVLGRIARETERRLAGEVLAGDLAGAEVVRRLAPFGLGERVWALALRGGAADTEPEPELAGPGLLTTAGETTFCLLAGEEDAALAERLRAGRPAGMGRAVAAADLRRTLLEARSALATAPAGLATFEHLGAVGLLLSLRDEQTLRSFCDALLGPLADAELTRSLDVFIECNGQWERAAKRLACHRHTLRYRIRRVEELTGRSLGSARDRIDFWLALRGRELTREESQA